MKLDNAQPVRKIAVTAPMLNEVEHVEGLVADLAEQDWERPLELLVADRRSTDGAAERLLATTARHPR